jgi:hypothetical protein
MTYQTIKIYKRPDESVKFHVMEFQETLPEAADLIFETKPFRKFSMIDPLTLMVTMDWPDQATRDAFFANPAIIAHFEKIDKSNADKGIIVDFQSAQEV